MVPSLPNAGEEMTLPISNSQILSPGFSSCPKAKSPKLKKKKIKNNFFSLTSVNFYVLFTNNAGSSLLQHIAQSYSDIESLQFADLIRDYSYRQKLRKYRFQEEVLRDLREERQINSFLRSYDPFIVECYSTSFSR